jgi:hypothetical protein
MRPRARYAKPAADGKNKLERRYGDHLEILRRAGEVYEYAFEPEKFRLADRTFYTPDYRVLMPDGTVEFHEVKGGFWEDDARVKIKVAADMHPYIFVAVQWFKGQWAYERFGGK